MLHQNVREVKSEQERVPGFLALDTLDHPLPLRSRHAAVRRYLPKLGTTFHSPSALRSASKHH
jgi:hypothetical protein